MLWHFWVQSHYKACNVLNDKVTQILTHCVLIVYISENFTSFIITNTTITLSTFWSLLKSLYFDLFKGDGETTTGLIFMRCSCVLFNWWYLFDWLVVGAACSFHIILPPLSQVKKDVKFLKHFKIIFCCQKATITNILIKIWRCI